ncbi:hypothetical protein OF83DRAFT_920050 [Amylostereum chailletii]|nr:hypothetical protein OF83DRAFT_920050 [Amylostereum chailletii]
MAVQCTGPMPVSDFLTQFTTNSEPASYRPLPGQVRVAKPSEIDPQHVHFIDPPGLCPHLVFSTPNDLFRPKATDNQGPLSRICATARPEASTSSSPSTHFRPTVELLIDYVQMDPFRDPIPDVPMNRRRFNFQRTSSKAEQGLRSQFLAINEIFSSQPRVFFFSILITDEGARLLRWDRAGVVVTERFDPETIDGPLAEFLCRFNDMPSEERGHDTTFSIPTREEIASARAAFTRSPYISILPETPLYKVSVLDDASSEESFYIVADPQVSNDRVFGSASRGYIAFDLSSGVLVWLKDVWRIDHPSFFKEGDVYRKLEQKDIPYVAPLCCAGDVPSQGTRTQEFSRAPWTCAPTTSIGRKHYRVVLGVVGRPLSSFTSTRELCTSIRDAIEAHGKAYTELNILHGDISAGNILITDDGHGLLIDWDLAFDVKVGRRGAIIGTWQFISSRLMKNSKNTEHQLCDDQESFVHVLLYHIIHFRPTGIPDLMGEIEDMFHHGKRDGVTRVVARERLGFFASCILQPSEFYGFIPDPCLLLLEELRALFYRGLYLGCSMPVTDRQHKEALKALQTPARVLKVFDKAIKKRGWLGDDGSVDAVRAYLQKVAPEDRESSEVVAGKRTVSDAFGDDSQSDRSSCAKRCRPSPYSDASST